MKNNQLKYLILAGIFLIPFVPLIVSSSLFFPFITGKSFAFKIIVEIILAAYLVLALRDESYRPKFSWVFGAISLFLICMTLADIFAVNPFKAFWSNYERMEGLLTMLHLGALFLVMGSVMKSEQVWNRLFATTLGASVIMIIYSLLQLFGKITINQGGVRVDGTFGNATYLAIYMVFHIFIAALLFARSRSVSQRVLLGIIALLQLVVLYCTATRGAILGLLGGALLTFIFLVFKAEKGEKIRKVALGFFLGLIILIGAFISLRNTSFVKNNYVLARFASLSTAEIQTQGRYYVWPMAIKGFLEKPILGWGQEGFNFVFNKYYDPKMYNQEPWFDRAHNSFLDWLVAGGILGFVSYILIFISLLFYIFKRKSEELPKEEKAVMLGLIAAYAFNNLFVFDQIGSYILFFTILAYVHSHTPVSNFGLWNKISSGFTKLFKNESLRPIFEAIVFILLVCTLYFFIWVPFQKNKELLEVLRINAQGQTGTIENYNTLLGGYGVWFGESLEHISQSAIAMAQSPNIDTQFKQQLFDLVDKGFTKQVTKIPTDTRYRLFYGMFLSRFGWYGRAIEQLNAAKDFSQNKQQIYFELANNYILDGKITEALGVAKHAYELEPSYMEARVTYALTAAASGDPSVGEKVFGELDPQKLVFDERYLSFLVTVKQYQKVIDIAKQRIAQEPQNFQHRITLTAAYLQANRRQEAIGVLEEMIKLDPSFKQTGDYYINEIKAGRNP